MKLRSTADGSLLRVLHDGRTQPYVPADQGKGPMALARRAREQLGLTQAAFALRFRLPVATIRDWEHGRRAPDAAALTLLRLIAEAPQALQRLSTRYASVDEAMPYLKRFAEIAGPALLRAETALILRHSPFQAAALSAAVDATEGNLPGLGKLKRALAGQT